MTKSCACGCGQTPRKKTSRFCVGHHGRGRAKSPRTPEQLAKLGASVSRAWEFGTLREKRRIAMQKHFENPEWREKHSQRLRQALSRPEVREKMSRSRINYLERHPESLQQNLTKNGRFSKLHQRARDFFRLAQFGFKSEQMVGTKQVDELLEDKKLIIEIYGDKWHANPKLYESEQIVKTGKKQFRAGDKWDSDDVRIKYLESLGYRVLVVWESDDWEQRQFEIERAISS